MKKQTETCVYLIDPDGCEIDNIRGLSDDDFMTEAENQGTVYSLIGFQASFNDDMINPNTYIRFINVKI